MTLEVWRLGGGERIHSGKDLPEKQRHTAKLIYERIKDMGYGGKYTQVKEAVREIKRLKREVFMPLITGRVRRRGILVVHWPVFAGC